MSKETDYLFEMYKKYAPTKMVGTYECETEESNKWLDNLIIAKKKIEALEIIKEHFEISKPVGIDIESNQVSCGCLVQKKVLTLDEYYLLKGILL